MTLVPASSHLFLDARYEALLDGLGLVTETFPRAAAAGGTGEFDDGSVNYMSIGLAQGDVISAVVLIITTAGVGVTLSKCGLYSQAGVRLGISADQAASWETPGAKIVPLTAAVNIARGGLYYVAAVAKASATLPGRLRLFDTSATLAIGAGPRYAATETGQTDLPATATFGAGGAFIWFGLA